MIALIHPVMADVIHTLQKLTEWQESLQTAPVCLDTEGRKHTHLMAKKPPLLWPLPLLPHP